MLRNFVESFNTAIRKNGAKLRKPVTGKAHVNI